MLRFPVKSYLVHLRGTYRTCTLRTFFGADSILHQGSGLPCRGTNIPAKGRKENNDTILAFFQLEVWRQHRLENHSSKQQPTNSQQHIQSNHTRVVHPFSRKRETRTQGGVIPTSGAETKFRMDPTRRLLAMDLELELDFDATIFGW